MSKLAALKKQIAALEAQAERIAKEEMSSAIAEVKAIMAEFNLTIEHLTHAVAGKRAAKKAVADARKVSKAAAVPVVAKNKPAARKATAKKREPKSAASKRAAATPVDPTA